MSLLDESEKERRIIVCISRGLEANLGKNVTITIFSRFRLATGLSPPDDLYYKPEQFMAFLNDLIPKAAPVIEKTIVDAIRSSFMLPKSREYLSLPEAIALARIPVLLKGDVTMDENEARILKCIQYALRDTFSEGTVQVIFEKFESTTNLGLRSVATRPDAFLLFLKSLFGPPVRNIEHVFVKELIVEFADVDLRPNTSFVDAVTRLRMNSMQGEIDWVT